VFFLIGLLLAQYTFTVTTASAHMTEETHNAAVADARIVWSDRRLAFAGVAAAHWCHLAIQTTLRRRRPYTSAQIFVDAVGKNLGTFLLFIVVGAQFYCGMSSVTPNSRMIYAFCARRRCARLPFWHKINPRTRTRPLHWFAAKSRFHPWPPYLWNPVAVRRCHVDRVSGLYIAYGIPSFCALAGREVQRGVHGTSDGELRDRMDRGDRIASLRFLFVLPQLAPGNTPTTFNYAILAVG